MSERARWQLWAWLVKFPTVCPANAHSRFVIGEHVSSRIDWKCRSDFERNGVCWCGKLRGDSVAGAPRERPPAVADTYYEVTTVAEVTTPRERPNKPLGQKAYGSIPHLPGSRLGVGDHHCHEGQARIATEKARDRHDVIIVQEKVDGSCCSVALVDGAVLALGRAGYLAESSPFGQHHLFATWVKANEERFAELLSPGERVVGEWMAQAHGTRYDLPHDPFIVFDIMEGHDRATVDVVEARCDALGFTMPHVVSNGPPLSVDAAMALVEPSWHGALDPVEGAVWRVERRGVVDFLVKWVRPDKVDGCYLPELSGADAVWNWSEDTMP